MEVDGFLEELLSLRREPYWESSITTFPTDMSHEFFSHGWNFNYFNENPSLISPNPSFQGIDLLNQQVIDYNSTLINEVINCNPFDQDGFLIPAEINSPADHHPFPTQEDINNHPLVLKNEEVLATGLVLVDQADDHHHEEQRKSTTTTTSSFKVEPDQVPVFDMATSCVDHNQQRNKNKVKKVKGQPSKNLMAERRRRKRLNDRLSMLRSVVPKISKMDRTSILGDTIDYMKELLERIKSLRNENEEVGSDHHQHQLDNLMDILMDFKPKEILVRNTPKFNVERRNDIDTRIEICCAGKPGLLLSTVTTLDALGLEIQQCVMSCFNDFSMQASCSEEMDYQRSVRSSAEEIKQSLFRNAGYGGRFL